MNVLSLYDGCIRTFNVLELERLQNLPDNYTKVKGVSNTQKKKKKKKKKDD